MKGPLKIKVCGLRDPENIKQVCSLNPDLVGYIFYQGSERYVGDDPDPAIFKIPAKDIKRVGVFVNEEITRVKQTYESCGLDVVQLHGSEPAGYCKSLGDTGIPVVKAVGLSSGESMKGIEEYMASVDCILFDTPGEGFGGTGLQFNWELLKGYNYPVPFLLSGGIGPGNVKAIRDIKNNHFHGIDVNSMFELSPGLKNVTLLEAFIGEIRK